MASADPTLLRAIALTIAETFLGDRASAESVAYSAIEWMEANAEKVGDSPLAWVTAIAVERSLATPPNPDRPYHRAREVLAEEVAAQPVSTRVALALVGICGFDRLTASQYSRRRVEEIDALLAPFSEILEDLVILRRSEPEPTTQPGVQALPETQPAAPPTLLAPRLPASVGTALSILLVIGLVLLVTVPHGERPTFAAPRSDPGGARGAACTTDGSTDATTLQVGAGNRPARLALPPGRIQAAPLILLIGDTGQSAEDVVHTTGLEAAAATQGIAVMSLDGTAQPWNVSAVADREDDIAMAADALSRAAEDSCLDVDRTVAVGFGTGAHLAAAIACSGEDRIRGLVMVRGAYAPPSCALAHGISVLIDSDTTDAILPFDGGWGISATRDPSYEPGASAATLGAWATLNECSTEETREGDASGIEVTGRDSCRDGVAVVSRTSVGYGHDWPPEVAGPVLELTLGLK
ncbi:MAG: hypothetical protein IT195_02095 [Microthrixaceae bacterium]|nr:hypothetical protein [Microthrixaceae bacterium]